MTTTAAYIIETDAGIQWVGEARSAMHALAMLYTQAGYPTHVTDGGDIVCVETDPAILEGLPGLEHVTTVTALRGKRAVRAMVECHDALPGWHAVRMAGTKRTVLTLAEAFGVADVDESVQIEPGEIADEDAAPVLACAEQQAIVRESIARLLAEIEGEFTAGDGRWVRASIEDDHKIVTEALERGLWLADSPAVQVTAADVEAVAARVAARLDDPFVELYEDNGGHLAIWCRAKGHGWVGIEQAPESGFALDAAAVLADADDFDGIERITASPMDTGTWTQVATYSEDCGVTVTEGARPGVAASKYIG